MKFNAIVCTVICASMGFSSLSFAQDHDRRGPDHNQPRQSQPQQQQQQPQRAQPNVQYRNDVRMDRHDVRHDMRNDHRYDRRDDRRYDNIRGNPHAYYYNARGPEFRRGGYIPREFRNRYYVVNNYRNYRLSPPPRGQQWVQVGSDYVLIAIATGLIASIVLSH